MRNLLYRNAQARDHLELFLVTAISSLLALRFYLYLTGYPQVGGGSLHIAHMLYGGLLMMISIVVGLTFLGVRAERVSALVGGVGFGIFIDELGKFITKDNNYFFRPTIGLIYALFCVLFLSFNFISRRQKLTNEEYQLNALRQFEEAVVHDMDKNEKAAMRDLLRRADKNNLITQELKAMLDNVKTIDMSDSRIQRMRRKITSAYASFWERRGSDRIVAAVFVLQALLLLTAVLGLIFHNFDSIRELFQASDSYSSKLIIGQLVSATVSAGFVIYGAIKLTTSRAEAFELFRRAVLINLFLGEFFIFYRIQFGAIPGFLINVTLLMVLHFAINQERRARHLKVKA